MLVCARIWPLFPRVGLTAGLEWASTTAARSYSAHRPGGGASPGKGRFRFPSKKNILGFVGNFPPKKRDFPLVHSRHDMNR